MIGMKKTNNNNKGLNNKSSDNGKKTELLSTIDKKLDDIGLEYGPIVYGELQSRLEKTIDIFNNDVETLFKGAFSTYKSSSNKTDKSKEFDEDTGKKPKYISDYEKSKQD